MSIAANIYHHQKTRTAINGSRKTDSVRVKPHHATPSLPSCSTLIFYSSTLARRCQTPLSNPRLTRMNTTSPMSAGRITPSISRVEGIYSKEWQWRSRWNASFFLHAMLILHWKQKSTNIFKVNRLFEEAEFTAHDRKQMDKVALKLYQAVGEGNGKLVQFRLPCYKRDLFSVLILNPKEISGMKQLQIFVPLC